MLTAALIFAGLSALFHGYIFILESLRWTDPATRKTFGTSVEEANATKELAFNQGFYNLFLAIVTAIGIIVTASGHQSVGAGLLLSGVGSMTAAALVLLISSPSKTKAALAQLTFPLIATILTTAWLVF